MVQREVIESEDAPIPQGVDERIPYTVTTTPWGSSPTAPAVAVKDVSNDSLDVTATVMPSGSPSVTGDVITLPVLRALTVGHEYRIEVQFTTGGKLLEFWFRVAAEI